MPAGRSSRVTDLARQGLRWLAWNPIRLLVAILVLLGVWVVLAQVGEAIESKPPAPAASPSADDLPSGWETWASAPATVVAGGPPASGGQPTPEPSGRPSTSEVEAAWDDVSRREAVSTAMMAVTAFTTGDQAGFDAICWRDTVIGVQPAAVTIIGPDPEHPGRVSAHVVDEISALHAQVVVPTTGGDYRVDIGRLNSASPWQVRSITTPGS